MAKVTQTSSRKSDHIRINLDEDVRSRLSTGLERYLFPHQALPELDLDEVDLSTKLLGKQLDAPLLISSMTGGTEEATEINRRLAEAAETRGIAIGVGSQRAALEDPSLAASFQVRKVAPGVLLFANLGAVQLNYDYGVKECQQAVDMIEADALMLHLNPLQEAVQPEGDTKFGGLLKKIEAVCEKLKVPVVVKEVGWGINGKLARKLVDAGVQAIDVAGAGGTSWTQVEMHRARDESQRRLAAAFADWGVPTADALQDVRAALPKRIPVFASGGIRSGVDIAKCIALGAALGGMASPYLKAAAVSVEATIQTIDEVAREIQVCMFASGAGDLKKLAKVELVERN